MASEFEVIEKAFGPVIEIEERTRSWRMPATFGRDYSRIAAYLSAQGAECVEMPYARYLDVDWERELGRGRFAAMLAGLRKRWHFYAGMVSSQPLPGEGELQARVLPRRRYARALHRGPYQSSVKTYAALYAWLTAQGLSAASEAIECYRNDPHEVTQAELETEILIPLR